MEDVIQEVTELYAELAESGALTPIALVFLASTVFGVVKKGIKFLLVAAVVLFVLTSLGIVVM